MSGFPWKAAMQLGFGVMRLGPKEFWGLTPRELAAAFAAQGGRRSTSPSRDGLNGLMERYPDGK